MKTRMTPEERERVAELTRQGFTRRQVAAEMGRSLCAVQGVIKAHGLSRKSRALDRLQASLAELEELRTRLWAPTAEGLPAPTLAEQLRICEGMERVGKQIEIAAREAL